MKYRKGSLAPEIVKLAHQGIGRREIARMVGCTPPNVYKTLLRHGIITPPPPPPARPRAPALTTRISVLSDEDRTWLRQEAKRMKVHWRDLARAILTDAIYEAKHGKN